MTVLLWIMGGAAYLSIGALVYWLLDRESDDGTILIIVWPLAVLLGVWVLVFLGIPSLIGALVRGESVRAKIREWKSRPTWETSHDRREPSPKEI